jgi:hypothetical protein
VSWADFFIFRKAKRRRDLPHVSYYKCNLGRGVGDARQMEVFIFPTFLALVEILKISNISPLKDQIDHTIIFGTF